MWYSGYDGTFNRIGYATSPDGIAWIKHEGNPILDIGSAGQWDDEGVALPVILKVASTYLMWFQGYEDSSVGRVGFAASRNATLQVGNTTSAPGQ